MPTNLISQHSSGNTHYELWETTDGYLVATVDDTTGFVLSETIIRVK